MCYIIKENSIRTVSRIEGIIMKQIISRNDEIYRLITASEHYEKTKELSDEEKGNNFLIIPEKTANESKSNNYYEKVYNASPAEQAIICELDDQNELLKVNNKYLKELLDIGYFFKMLAIIGIVLAIISTILQFIH